MKRKKIALYDPYLDVMGGGERHILSILQVMQQNEYDPIIFWNEDLNKTIFDTLHLTFDPKITFRKNIFTDPQESIFSRLEKLKEFDMFIYVTDGSYFFSTAKKNFIFCMVPQKSLYNMSAVNKLKTLNSTFIANSHYTQKWLQKWGVKAQVVYPFISDEFFANYSEKKEKIILVVGRFFKQLHAKRQDVAIQWFQHFQKEKLFSDYKLIVAGNVKEEDNDYYKELTQLAGDNSRIEFKPNISFSELLKLYKTAEIYWHMAGIDIDTSKNPEKVEHLGITPLEAMASGCIVLGYNAGGLQELITDGKTGFLFKSQRELANKMNEIINNKEKLQQIRTEAFSFVKENFNYSAFSNRVTEIFL